MMKIINNYLNSVTMYRLVLYYLIILVLIASVFGYLGYLPYNGNLILLSAIVLVGFSWLANYVYSKTFETPVNIESLYISALILTLIIAPMKSIADLPFIFWAAVLTMASKYLIAIRKKHIFNPVAISIFLMSIFTNHSAIWWIGTSVMFIPVILGGYLVAKKIRREDMVYSYIITATITVLIFSIFKGVNLFSGVQKILIYSPLLFMGFVMLTEPLTTPPKKNLQIIYGALTGFLFAPQVHLGSFYTTPEIALLIGNIFSYLVSPKEKLLLKLKERIKIGHNLYEFIFETSKKLSFSAGQYMEWTLEHAHADNRGNRRYFTIASSPTERHLRLGVKFYERSSSFKKKLLQMNGNDVIMAGQLAGDFTLPKDPKQKLVFIAGGIGITPFRSMIKYLLDTNQSEEITLFYSIRTADEIVYDNILEEARAKLNLKIIYVLSDLENIPALWSGKTGFIDQKMIVEEISNLQERHFYISGPPIMVSSFENILTKMGVKKKFIHTDFFPGF